jgi:hypothetical protein
MPTFCKRLAEAASVLPCQVPRIIDQQNAEDAVKEWCDKRDPSVQVDSFVPRR